MYSILRLLHLLHAKTETLSHRMVASSFQSNRHPHLILANEMILSKQHLLKDEKCLFPRSLLWEYIPVSHWHEGNHESISKQNHQQLEGDVCADYTGRKIRGQVHTDCTGRDECLKNDTKNKGEWIVETQTNVRDFSYIFLEVLVYPTFLKEVFCSMSLNKSNREILSMCSSFQIVKKYIPGAEGMSEAH